VSWWRIGALNDRFDWVANALGLNIVNPNSWIEDADFARDGLHLNGRGKRRLGQLYARVSGLDVVGSAESKKSQILNDGNHRTRDSRQTRRSAIEEGKTLSEENGPVTRILVCTEVEVGQMFKSTAKASAEEECVAATVEHISEGKPLVLLQVNCKSICNKILEFSNLIDTYNSDLVICTEPWLNEEINNDEIFRDDYITFSRDRCCRDGGVFICVKNYINCRVLWTYEVFFEMIAIEVKGRHSKFAWNVVGIYRAPNEVMRVIEKLAARTGFTGNATKRTIIGGDLNLPYADWNGNAVGNSGTQHL